MTRITYARAPWLLHDDFDRDIGRMRAPDMQRGGSGDELEALEAYAARLVARTEQHLAAILEWVKENAVNAQDMTAEDVGLVEVSRTTVLPLISQCAEEGYQNDFGNRERMLTGIFGRRVA